MGQRSEDPRIKKLIDSGLKIYSFSKLSNIETCKYSAWKTYIKGEKGLDSVYTILGNSIHDSLQELMEEKITEKDLWPNYQKAIQEIDCLDLDFPKDTKGTNSIREKYLKCMEYFCKHYMKPAGSFLMEELLILSLPKDRAIIGYADLIKIIDKEKKICAIYDYKSSSEYRGNAIKEHGRQLAIYKMAMEQAGWTVVGVFWIFLKYSTIKYKKRTKYGSKTVSRHCENTKISNTIIGEVKKNYTIDELDAFDQFNCTDDLTNLLPKSIMSNFKIIPYVVEYIVTDDVVLECMEYIDRVATEYESLALEKDIPWSPIVITKENSFFCNNLCSHRKTCEALNDYNSKAEYRNNDMDLF